MAIISIEELAAQLYGPASLIGLDLGTKTIGIAVSDISRQIASPRETLKRSKFQKDGAYLLSLIEDEAIAGMILGLPINMDGSEGPRAQSTRAFARNFTSLGDIPIVLWDERLSSLAAERALLEADISRAKRAQRIDNVAAALILQSALDRLKAFNKR